MKKIVPLILVGLFILNCNNSNSVKSKNLSTSQVDHDVFFQYNIWWSFVNKIFDAPYPVHELKKQGDLGLGSFNLLDGELVMLDGIAYRIRENGEITEGKDTDGIIYANVVKFNEEYNFSLHADNMDQDMLKNQLTNSMYSPNYFYAFIIKGTFDYIKCGGLNKQKKPFIEGLDILIPNRPVFEGEKISGTIVGFYCPDFIGNINAKQYHFHFISDDKKLGGHVMDFITNDTIEIGVDKKKTYHFYLPRTEDFDTVGFDKDFQYVDEKKSK